MIENMGRSEGSLTSEILGIALTIYGIIDGLNGFQRTLWLVDRIIAIGKALSSPWGDWVILAGLALFLAAVKKLERL